ncbi:MAG: SufE family protein [Rikenellaceae bacterium]|nr:SufE family protein [Rikenellaceae bacterium]
MTINEEQDRIVEEFALYDDWMDKYNYLIELSSELEPLDGAYRNDKYLISGCQSRVWIAAKESDGVITFQADSDAIITKGLAALLIRVLSGHTAQEIYDAELYFIDRIGMSENLSPTRANGLVSMIKQMKLYALAYLSRKND